MDNREFQYAMYGLTAAWFLILAYVVSITMRERKLREELDRVRRMVEQDGKD